MPVLGFRRARVEENLPRKIAGGIGGVSVLLGCVLLAAGWAFGLEGRALPGLSAFKPNTALALVLLGAGLATTAARPAARRLADGLAVLAIGLGLVTLAEFAFRLDLRIDHLMAAGWPVSRGLHPGRIEPSTALAIDLLGVALLCTHRPAAHWVKSAGATGAMLIAWAALSSYVFRPGVLEAVPLFGSMALHTAVMIFLLGVGVLAAPPMSWPVRTMLSNGVGGLVCRWLLPPAVLAPPAIGWLLTRRNVLDLFPLEFDWALYSAIFSVGSVLLILSLARRIELIDAERNAAAELSQRDPLTGLANRRAFDTVLGEVFRLARRHERPLALVLLDVDHFKAYNDEYGHPAGDALLKGLGGILGGAARTTDLVARIGGEEFALVLPETDLRGARHMAEHLRAAVERSPAFRRRVTVSIGVAALPSAATTPMQLVSDCDVALYGAKSAGRNRVACADGFSEA